MKIGDTVHLTYCTNVHPAESWTETRAALAAHLPEIKRRVSPHAPMGVGLRLSAAAALELEAPQALEEFSDFLSSEGLYVFTINGFPYGAFHQAGVKDRVYLPNWREDARLLYTNRLANILARLLPEGVDGSISTVPGAYLRHLPGARGLEEIADKLIRHAAHLHSLHARTGKFIALALEPEPDCLLETSAQAIDFFGRHLHSPRAVEHFCALTGLDPECALDALKRHLGLCLDICHLAVAFESPADAIEALQEAEIALHKIQLSAALKIAYPGEAERAELRPFAEDVYLHQVAALDRDGITRWPDLPDALADRDTREEWRIHFHVPLWAEHIGSFSTTADAVREVLALHKAQPLSPHLEVETYTWDVLGDKHRLFDLTTSIARELSWVREQLA
jgi:sugar phosphate isomerase/epimerase